MRKIVILVDQLPKALGLLLLMTLLLSEAAPASEVINCSRFVSWISSKINQQSPGWTKHLKKLGGYGTPDLEIFDKHIVTRIEAMLTQLTPEEQKTFITIMGMIEFKRERKYGGAYYRLLGEMAIELDPHLFGHPMSRFVYIHELRHVFDDLKSGFPPAGLDLDTITTEAAALLEGYDYLSLVNNDSGFSPAHYPKNAEEPQRRMGENDQSWAKRKYDDVLGVEFNAIRKLSREEYLGKTIGYYKTKEDSTPPFSIWGELFKHIK